LLVCRGILQYLMTESDTKNTGSSQSSSGTTQCSSSSSQSSDSASDWEHIEVKQVSPSELLLPPTMQAVRFVVISDTHNHHDALTIPKGDVVIHCGDFTRRGKPEEVESFISWFSKLPHPHKILVAGNHDMVLDEGEYDNLWKRWGHPEKYETKVTKDLVKRSCIYLEDEEVKILGYRIYGSPWQPEFHQMAFNLERGEKIAQKWKKIPTNTDILVTHGPPLGYGDLCKSKLRAGCLNLLSEIQKRIKPKFHLYGHIHEAYGITTDTKTVFINASNCNIKYERNNLNPPIVFDLPRLS